MGWTAVVQFRTGAMMRFFLFVTVSRQALGTVQLPIQWVPGVKRPGRADVKNSWSCTSTSVIWRGA